MRSNVEHTRITASLSDRTEIISIAPSFLARHFASAFTLDFYRILARMVRPELSSIAFLHVLLRNAVSTYSEWTATGGNPTCRPLRFVRETSYPLRLVKIEE